MVNPGRRSEACTRCRARRVKCDAQKPSCGNCMRLRTTCPGYPDTAGIAFRDDTDRTRARAQRMYRNLRSRSNDQETSDSESSDLNRVDSNSPRKSPSDTQPQTLTLPERNPVAFASTQIIGGSIEVLSKHLNMRGFAAYIDRIYDAVQLYPQASGPLKTSVELLALAAYADSPQGSHLQIRSVTNNLRSRVTMQINSALDQLKAGVGNHEHTLLAVGVILVVDCYFYFRDSSALEIENGVRTHFDGMSAIAHHAGPSLLKTELGRKLYVNVFMSHLQAYSPTVVDFPPIPGPENALEIILNEPGTDMAEYRILPLLRRSFDLRREAVRTFIHQPQLLSTEIVTDLKEEIEQLRVDFEIFWAKLSAARKYGGSGMCRWVNIVHWVHRILTDDTYVRCFLALRQLEKTPEAYEDRINDSVESARLAVHAICQGMPYLFNEMDLPSAEEEPPNFLDVLFAWNGHHPLLVCSMVGVLSEDQHQGITYARAACARAAGLKQPIRSLPRMLLQVS